MCLTSLLLLLCVSHHCCYYCLAPLLLLLSVSHHCPYFCLLPTAAVNTTTKTYGVVYGNTHWHASINKIYKLHQRYVVLWYFRFHLTIIPMTSVPSQRFYPHQFHHSYHPHLFHNYTIKIGFNHTRFCHCYYTHIIFYHYCHGNMIAIVTHQVQW